MKSLKMVTWLLWVVLLGGLTTPVFAGTYWVSPSGSASWSTCQKSTDPGSNYCSLSTANSSAVAGDTVYLKGGTYNTHIFPSASGTSGSRITYAAASGEKPVVINTATTYATYYHGVALIGRSYVTVRGVRVGPDTSNTMNRILMISNGASYNEIDSCQFFGNFKGEVVRIWKGSSNLGDEYGATHNWIHNSTIANNMLMYESTGSVYQRMGLQIGDSAYDHASGYNTLDNNTFYCNGHHNIETFTKYNVIRNNFIENAPCVENTTVGTPAYSPDANGKYSHRNIQIYDGAASEGMYNLIEGNRFGPSGAAPENDGGDGFTLTAPKNILRYNSIYGAQNNGILLKTGASSFSDNNRIYNNTIYHSARYKNGPQWQGWNFRWYGSYVRTGNVVKNNILYGYGTGGADWGGGSSTIYTDNTVSNNFCTTMASGRCSAQGDPLFVDGTLPDADSVQSVKPRLMLQAGSPAIDGGTYLTTTKGSGASTTSLTVNDALFFQDGRWGSSLAKIKADWIAIGTVDNVVQISSINYSTNTITLTSAKTWVDGAPIWLYKKSDGAQVLYGSAPDYGAYEYGLSMLSLSAPGNLRIQ